MKPWAGWTLSCIAILFGGAAFIAGWRGPNENSVITSGGSVVVAGLALFGVTSGLQSWRDERAKARVTHERETYVSLVQGLLGRFTGTPFDPVSEAKTRSVVSVWASSEVVREVAAWRDVFARHTSSNNGASEQMNLDPAASVEFSVATAKVVRAVRKQLKSEDTVTVEELRSVLFDRTADPTDPAQAAATQVGGEPLA